VSADSCCVAASISHGGTANFRVFEGVNKETRLESSVPDNPQKRGSPKLKPVGGSERGPVLKVRGFTVQEPQTSRRRRSALKLPQQSVHIRQPGSLLKTENQQGH
jgi:hypothetical protein